MRQLGGPLKKGKVSVHHSCEEYKGYKRDLATDTIQGSKQAGNFYNRYKEDILSR